MTCFFLLLRSSLFTICLVLSTLFFGVVSTIAIPFPYRYRYGVIRLWSSTIIGCAKIICGIRYRVEGRNNLPHHPVIFLSKHQSAWETIFYPFLFSNPLVFVLKKELLWIPIFGWCLASLRMIPINRSQGRDAFSQVLNIGKARLDAGISVIFFPEGTRIPVGQAGTYKTGGARLAIATQTPIIPIAVHSGHAWPKNAFIKYPGIITVSIGQPIMPDSQDHTALSQRAATWIESEMRRIAPEDYMHTAS